MKLILLKEVSGLGDAFDVVDVKNGYGRNYLIPKKMAIPATDANFKNLEQRKKIQQEKGRKDLEAARAIEDKLTGASIKTSLKVGGEEKVFGSITSSDISELIKLRRKVEVDHHQIKLDKPIRSPGVYAIPIQLHPDVTIEIKLWVVRQKVEKE